MPILASHIKTGARPIHSGERPVGIIDHDAIKRAKRQTADLHAIERGFIDGGEPEGIFAELAVVAVRRPAVVLLHLGEEGVCVEAETQASSSSVSALAM